MKKLILILLIIIPFTISAQAWGKAKSKDVDDILVIDGNKKGMIVITPKQPLVFVLDTEESVLIIQYLDAEIPIRNMPYKDIRDAIKIIEQVYPDYQCLDNYGLKKCDLKMKYQVGED